MTVLRASKCGDCDGEEDLQDVYQVDAGTADLKADAGFQLFVDCALVEAFVGCLRRI